jgi:DNA-binding PadR family transcriptional regulator
MKAEILILGVLHRGNLHPYEIKRRLTTAMIQCFTDVDVGTLYYAVRQLNQSKLIAPVSQKRVVRGGIKTVYRITPSGKRRFQQLLHEQFTRSGTVAQTLYIAMLFLHLCYEKRSPIRNARSRNSIKSRTSYHRCLGQAGFTCLRTSKPSASSIWGGYRI